MKSWNAFRSLFAVTTMQFSEQCACHIYRGSGINKASIALGKNLHVRIQGLGRIMGTGRNPLKEIMRVIELID